MQQTKKWATAVRIEFAHALRLSQPMDEMDRSGWIQWRKDRDAVADVLSQRLRGDCWDALMFERECQ